jgi:ATP-binding cassette subfamily F protein uup
VSKAYGTRSLFERLTFGLFEGDQAGLVGPNGSGKSTLLKILAGIEAADRGSRSLRGGVRVGYVPQDPVFPTGHTVDAVVLAAVTGVDEEDRPGRLAHALSRSGFADGRAAVDTLSGGWRKRLAIARELAAAPDILLMDEPTNHLDVEGILWLEDLLTERSPAFLVVSHDRYFLEHVATRMLELNRSSGRSVQTDEPREFPARRDEISTRQAAYQDAPATTVRREIEWPVKQAAHEAKGPHRGGARPGVPRGPRARPRPAGESTPSSQRRTRRLPVARLTGRAAAGACQRPRPRRHARHTGRVDPNGSGKTTPEVLAGSRPGAGEIGGGRSADRPA